MTKMDSQRILQLLCLFLVSISYVFADIKCKEASDFACDFEQDCPCWRQGQNGVEDDVDWSTGTQVALLGWNSIPRSRNENNATFAYVVRDGDHLLSKIPRGAMFISKAIPCSEKSMNIKLYYWKAAWFPQLRICYKYTDSSEIAQCLTEVSGFQPSDWLPLAATIPPLDKEFQIVIQANKLFGLQTVVGIDDVTMEGDLICSKNKNDAKFQSIDQINSTSKPINNATATLSLKGSVQNAKKCQNVKLADSWTGEYNRGVWHPCENSDACKPSNGGATTWIVEGDGTYVLESQQFNLDTDSIVKFQYQFIDKSFTSKLRLCIDALDTCPFAKRGSSQTEKWTQESILLTPGWHKIYFTVTNLKKTDLLKLRRISVDAKSNANCTLIMTLIDE